MSRMINTFKQVYEIMNSEDAVLVYSGEFDQEIVKSMLKYTEDKTESIGVDNKIRKKIFNVTVEMLQNIIKHQYSGESEIVKPIFVLVEKDDCFQLVTGNPILKSTIKFVLEKIDKVNGMDIDELKVFYKETRLASRISEVGGAGLGFIDMARKSGNPLEYKCFPIESLDYEYFTLKIDINKEELNN